MKTNAIFYHEITLQAFGPLNVADQLATSEKLIEKFGQDHNFELGFIGKGFFAAPKGLHFVGTFEELVN